MANAFTTNLNLVKPEVGADTDAWGGHFNGDFDALDAMLGGAIFGLTLSTAGSSSTFGVAAGGASGMALASAYTKTTSAWAVGTGNGSLDTGSVANATWYHVWLIQRVDTGVVDVLTSLSATAPTMPTNYTRKRRIGAMKTDGSAKWTFFHQLGDEFLWDNEPVDQSSATLTSTKANYAVSTPPGVQTIAMLNVAGSGGTAGENYLNVTSPDQFGGTVAATRSQVSWSGGVNIGTGFVQVRTDTSSQVQAITSSATSASLILSTRGWIDPRGRF